MGMKSPNTNLYKTVHELYDEHNILVDVDNKEIVLKKQVYRILDNFTISLYIMKFCTDEHLTGRILRKEM